MKQAAFLLLDQLEALYGGAAGGGKSDALLMAALQYVDVPAYRALLVRRTYTDLALPGALMDRAHHWLGRSGARWNAAAKQWRFPSGAILAFGYLDHSRDKYRYQSSEFQFIGFDELTQFHEEDYTYLFSRLRRTEGIRVPPRMRAASNPGGIGHDWVRRRFLIEGANANRIFLPATLADNPHLDRDEYARSLDRLDPRTRAQLLEGDWDTGDDALVPYEDLLACQSDCLWDRPPVRQRRDLYLGMDVGRTRDRSVVWTWEKVGDVAWCRDLVVLANASFAEQKVELMRRLRQGASRCAIDKGGIGYQLAEELERQFPSIVQGVQLTPAAQGRLARRLATALAERRVRIPDDEALRADFRLVRRARRLGGLDRVETGRSDDGHGDRFWAAALAFEALAADEQWAPRASLPRTIRR